MGFRKKGAAQQQHVKLKSLIFNLDFLPHCLQ